MLSRNETIRQALSEMEPQEEATVPVSFSGAVAQVTIITHATIHIGSLQILADGDLSELAEHLRPKERDNKVTRLQPLPKSP